MRFLQKRGETVELWSAAHRGLRSRPGSCARTEKAHCKAAGEGVCCGHVDEKLCFLPGARCPASGRGGLVRGLAGIPPGWFRCVCRPAGCRCPAARLYRPALRGDGGQARGGPEHRHVRGRGARPALQPRAGGAGSREPFLRRGTEICARRLRAAPGADLFRHQDREQARPFRHHGHQESQDGRLQLGGGSDPAHLPGLPPALHLSEGRPAGRQRQGLAAQGRAGHDRAGADGVPGIPESRREHPQHARQPDPPARTAAHRPGLFRGGPEPPPGRAPGRGGRERGRAPAHRGREHPGHHPGQAQHPAGLRCHGRQHLHRHAQGSGLPLYAGAVS